MNRVFRLRISSQKKSALSLSLLGHAPCTAGTFRKKIQKKSRKDPGNALRAVPGIPLESTAGNPQPYNSRHLRLPEHFRNSLPLSTAGDASFFRSGSWEGLLEPVMEFPAVLRAFLFTTRAELKGTNYMGQTGFCKKQKRFSAKISGFLRFLNSVQTRCIVKGEAQKSPLFSRCSGGFCFFSGSPVL